MKIRYSDLWGSRENKYQWLEKHTVSNTKWQDLEPVPDQYFFVPRDTGLEKEYEKGWKVTNIFPVNSVGIVTARDSLTIHWHPEEAWNTVLAFTNMAPEEARTAYKLGPDAQDWRVEWAQKDVRESGPNQDFIKSIIYRPFDIRYTYYTGNSSGFQVRPRPEVMRNMLKNNLALIVPRRVETDIPWQHALVSDTLVEHVAVSLKTIDYVFPLWLSDGKEQAKKLESQTNLDFGPTEAHVIGDRATNIDPAFLSLIRRVFPGAAIKQIFSYIYAILYSPKYRKKYAEFLKTDFPRIPLPKNEKQFRALALLGKTLTDLHLLEREAIRKLPKHARFQGRGDKVEKRDYRSKERQLWFNETQYVEGIDPEVWEYQIGGYQVLDKWLKDRTGRELTDDEKETYLKIIAALGETIKIQKEIDKVFTP